VIRLGIDPGVTSVICVMVPIRIVSEANGSHGHWAARARRTKAQRESVRWSLARHTPPPLPVRVTLTRIAPRAMDAHDNLPIGCKHVADQVAQWLGVQDNNAGITWAYGQRKGKPGEYAAEIAIEWEQHA